MCYITIKCILCSGSRLCYHLAAHGHICLWSSTKTAGAELYHRQVFGIHLVFMTPYDNMLDTLL